MRESNERQKPKNEKKKKKKTSPPGIIRSRTRISLCRSFATTEGRSCLYHHDIYLSWTGGLKSARTLDVCMCAVDVDWWWWKERCNDIYVAWGGIATYGIKKPLISMSTGRKNGLMWTTHTLLLIGYPAASQRFFLDVQEEFKLGKNSPPWCTRRANSSVVCR